MTRPTSVRALTSLCAVCVGLAAACAPLRPGGADRPERYAESWTQFAVDTYTNPRQVSLLRLGAGEARRAEYWVFEWQDEGQRLVPLHRTTLRSEWVPWSWRAAGDGRFLVTFDDRFEPQGSTENCVVIYDFVRGETVARRADDFVPAQWLGSASDRTRWDGGPAFVDPLLQVIYTTTPKRAREGTNPFLVIDLPSRSVRVEAIPDELPARAYGETSDGHAWEWEASMGDDPEPSWLAPFALPTLLKGKRVRPIEASSAVGLSDDTVYFRLDAAQGAYVRCPAEAWRDPKPD